MTRFKPDVRPRAAYPEVAAAEDALQARDWTTVRAVYDQAAGWPQRMRIVDAARRLPGTENLVRQVTERDPGDVLASTMLAARLVRVGWDIRTDKPANKVSRKQVGAFHDHLRRADEILEQVRERDSAFVPALAERVTIARGLNLGIPEAQRRYDEVAWYDPHNLAAQSAMLQQLCPKWGGTWLRAHAFAAGCARSAPAGYPNAVLVAEAHLEHSRESYVDLEYFNQAVRDEIARAGERSVLHPNFNRDLGWVYPLTIFTLAYLTGMDWTRANRCYAGLGDKADLRNWKHHYRLPARAFVSYRTRAARRAVPAPQAQFVPNFEYRKEHPARIAADAAIRARDWSAFRAVYDQAGSWLERALVMGTTDDIAGSEGFLGEVVDREPDDLVAATMLGTRLVVAGWKIRTRYRHQHVSQEQFAAFHDHLRRAEDVLAGVCARDPAFVPAWSTRVTIARGLGRGQAEARRLYDRLTEHEPHYFPAQASLLQYLCPKWGGDFATMHAFAAECTAAAPAGHPSAGLVVQGHLEHWGDLEGDEARHYFENPWVREELRAAGEKSVLHPDFQPDVWSFQTLSLFAVAYTMLEDWPSARHCFTRLGPYADEAGWEYMSGGPEGAFLRFRAVAMEKG